MEPVFSNGRDNMITESERERDEIANDYLKL